MSARAIVAGVALAGAAAFAPIGVVVLSVAAAAAPTEQTDSVVFGDGSATASPYTGGPTGCTLSDPTGTDGCVTGSTAHALVQVEEAFGDWPVSCWDAHAWNPKSDHPRGLGCDYTVGGIGRFPSSAERARGWQLAQWLLDNAGPLSVRYVIWDGRYCPAGGSCRPYSGGGVYSPADVTGGHYDHVHLSLNDRSGSPS